MSKTSVFVPIISTNGRGSHFIEILSEKRTANSPTVAGFTPVLGGLPVGLINQGYSALQQVTSFIIHRKSRQIEAIINHPLLRFLPISKKILYDIFDISLNLFIYTNTSWLDKLCLYANGVKGIISGNSAELGTAIALLLPSNRKALPEDTCIIATGALGGLGGKVNIKEVKDIPEKLQLALDEKQKGKLGLLPNKYYIFYTPIYIDEENTQKIIDRPEIKLLKAEGIEVRPCAELKEIVKELNLLPIRLAHKRIWLTGGLLASSLFLWSYKDPKIEVGFYPIKNGFTAKPFLICNKYEGRIVKYFPFKKDGSYNIVNMPAKAIDNWYVDMGWSIKMPEETGLNAYYPKSWQGYHLTYINVADKTGLTIYPEEKKLQGGQMIKKRWQLKEPAKEEASLLAIVASYQPLDLIKLEADLKKIPQEHHSSIRNHLNKNYNKVLFFHYLVKLKPSSCRF